MQKVALALGGLVLGFVLGGLKPRADLLDAVDVHVQELAEACPERPRSRVLPGIGEILPDLSEPRKTEKPDEGTPDALNIELSSPNSGQDEDLDDVSQQFDLAVDAQNLRAAQSRQALAEQADLSDEDMAVLDDIIAAMNEDLGFYGEDLMDMALSEEPDPTDALGLTHDVTGVLYESQLALDDLVGDADVEDEARMVWNHLDLEVFRDAVDAVEEAD